MRRREFVRSAGALATAGAAGATGCLGLGEAIDENVVWAHGVGGSLDAVSDGTVYGREDWSRRGERGAFALDASDGEREWTYGDIGGSSTYTRLVVDDGVYFGYGDDEVGGGNGDLYALEASGEERWVRDVGGVYDAPVVDDGTVYVSSDEGKAYAFDEEGDEVWMEGFDAPEGNSTPLVSVEAVEDGVAYVKAYGSLYALDATDGDEIWSYEGERVSNVAVSDGTVYTTRSGRVVAYAGGDKLWNHEVEMTNPHLRGVAHGNVYFAHRRDLRALEATEGDERWLEEVGEDFPVVLGEEAVYTGGGDLRSFSPEGEERWAVGLDGSGLGGISLYGGSVYAVTEETAYRVENGVVKASVGIPGDTVRNHLVDEDGRLYVGGQEGVYGIELTD